MSSNIENNENTNFNFANTIHSNSLNKTKISHNFRELYNDDLNESHKFATLSNKNINDSTSPLLIYKKIKKVIENYIFDCSEKKSEKICETLNEILIAINLILEDNSSPKNEKLNINTKITYLLKIQKLNHKIKNLQEKLEFFQRFLKNKNISQKYVEVLMKRFNEQKMTSKKNEFKYLLIIEEQEKKINELEKKLISTISENIDENTIKSIKCFPYYQQYDFKDDINPKSIPLYKQFQKLKLHPSRNTNKNSSIKSAYNQNTKSSVKSIDSKTLQTPTRFNIKNINKTPADSNRKMRLTKYDFHRKLNLESSTKTNRQRKIFTSRKNTAQKDIDNNDNLNNNIVEKYMPKTILDNNKKFFIAHPRLSIAGVVKNKEVRYEGLPKKILRLTLHKNLEKNILITFPSSLNETLVNLQKLRKLKNK